MDNISGLDVSSVGADAQQIRSGSQPDFLIGRIKMKSVPSVSSEGPMEFQYVIKECEVDT